MSHRRHTHALFMAGAIGAVAAVPLLIVTKVDVVTWFYSLAFVLIFATGIVAERSQPDNRAARLLLAFGAVAMFWNSAGLALVYMLFHGIGGEAGLVAANTVVLMLDGAVGTIPLAVIAVYPDGRYQRRYERVVVRVALGLVVAVPLALLLCGGRMHPALIMAWAHIDPQLANPLAVGSLDWLRGALVGYANSVLTIPPIVGAAIALARYRRFDSQRRVQLMWPFGGAALLALSALTDPLNAAGYVSDTASNVFEIATLVAAPALFAIGIVRPALFDIRVALRRSLWFGLLWAVIAVAYIGVAAAIGVAAGTGGVEAAVIVAIAVTLLFQPVWRHLVRRASQSVYGERLGGDELLRRIGSTLEHTFDLDELATAVAATVREGLGVSWVRIELDGAPAAGDGEIAELGAVACSAQIADGDTHLGRIECGPRPGGRLSRSDRELLATLGRQAALAIRNARLAQELAGRLEEIARQSRELSASRARIVEAHERGRRQIERDIHDGVQQELVALIARIGLARTQLRRNPDLLDTTLSDLQLEARQALADLRELASGIHPSVLSDRGIVEAIESRASRLPLGVTIECDRALRGARYPEAVEGAAYFTVCEGFANALKHSGAERVTVRLVADDGRLSVEVSDRGRGFDGDARGGSGLHGLADRIEALGGSFSVMSAPDAGTTIAARLPVHERLPA